MSITYAHNRREMLQFLPDTAMSVLDVGCSSGQFGSQIRGLARDTVLHGVEPNPDAASIAEDVYDEVAVGMFPDVRSRLPSGVFYDAIYFNDVLEHMPDPVMALRAAREMLSPAGVVIASIPNIGHISVLGPLLLRDEFRYRDTGILDNTHLRFFTRRTILRMFEEEGWEVISIRGINRVLHVGQDATSWWIRTLGKLTGGRSDRFFFVQYVTVVRPR